jgi:aryl-alcohol dehydrogenase-like predicted oxidoreductase
VAVRNFLGLSEAGAGTIRRAHATHPVSATVAQLAIAWVLCRGQDIVPLVGTTKRDRLAQAVDALQLKLNEDDLAAIERAASPVPRRGSLRRAADGHARQRAQPSSQG